MGLRGLREPHWRSAKDVFRLVNVLLLPLEPRHAASQLMHSAPALLNTLHGHTMW